MNKIEKLYAAYVDYCEREDFPEPTREEFEKGEIGILYSTTEIPSYYVPKDNAPEFIKEAYEYARTYDDEISFQYSYNWKEETEKIWVDSEGEGDPDIIIPYKIEVMTNDLDVCDSDTMYGYVWEQMEKFFKER